MNKQAESLTTNIGRTLDSLFAAGKAVGEDGSEFDLFPIGLRLPQGNALAGIAAREGAVRTIESGFAMGISGLFLMKATMETAPREAEHFAIDPSEKSYWKNAGLCAFEAAGVRDRLHFYDDNSEYVLPRLIEKKESFDLGFIDGNHRFEGALMDLTLMQRVMKPGGLIVVDDTWMPSVRAAIQYFIENMGVTAVTEYGDDPKRWILKRLFGSKSVRKSTTSNMVALRIADEPVELPWNAFHPFSIK